MSTVPFEATPRHPVPLQYRVVAQIQNWVLRIWEGIVRSERKRETSKDISDANHVKFLFLAVKNILQDRMGSCPLRCMEKKTTAQCGEEAGYDLSHVVDQSAASFSLAHSLFQSENNDNHNKAPLLIQLHYSLVEFTIADKNPWWEKELTYLKLM